MSNKKYLLSLAEITSSNFKDVRTDIANLRKETNNKFHRYLHKLMHTTADTIFYKNYILHYVNISSPPRRQSCYPQQDQTYQE